jgi:hypothetical protein
MEQRVQTGQSGGLFRNPPPRPQKDEVSEREIVHSPVISAQDAREGAVGHNVRYVLGFGLAAIIIVFIAIYAAYFA